MSNTKGNPLYNVFLKNTEGKLSEEIENINNIPYFFNFLKNDKIPDKEKQDVLLEFKNIIEINRNISPFFASNNSKSIYLYLFDLYSKKNTSESLKQEIIFLIEVLLRNIQTGKDIYEYLFQKVAQIYRGEIEPNPENLYTYLKLLHTVFEPRTPKNYFACCGHCQFSIDLNKVLFEVGYSFTINLNFKINNLFHSKERISNLVKIYFSNKKSLSFDLKYPFFL